MGKLQLFSLKPIFAYQVRALRGSNRRNLALQEYLMLYFLPVMVAAAFIGFRFQLTGIAQLLSATSLLVGTMLSAFVFLANLRIKISESDEHKLRTNLKELVASSAVGALYVSTIAMILALCLAVMASWPWLNLRQGWQCGIASGICAALLVHLIVSFTSVVRRLLGIYDELFDEDFMAKPDP